jgi:hypothetical protein
MAITISTTHPLVDRLTGLITEPWRVFVNALVNTRTQGGITVLVLGDSVMGWASAAPTSGTWSRGDVIWHVTPSVGQPNGWRCTASGTPGTWVAMVNL